VSGSERSLRAGKGLPIEGGESWKGSKNEEWGEIGLEVERER